MTEQDLPRLLLRDLPYRERARTRLEKLGAPAVSTVELLAVLIGSGNLDSDGLLVAFRHLATWRNCHGHPNISCSRYVVWGKTLACLSSHPHVTS